MRWLKRWFPDSASADAMGRIASKLPRARNAPDRTRLRCVSRTVVLPVPDWMTMSLHQNQHTSEIWINVTGGIAGIDYWYGPGDPALLSDLNLPGTPSNLPE